MSTDPGSLKSDTRLSQVPGRRIPWSIGILGPVPQFWQDIHNLYNNTGYSNCQHRPIVQQPAFCGRWGSCEAAESAGLWSYTATPTTTTSTFNDTYRRKGNKPLIQEVLLGLSSPISQLLPVHCYREVLNCVCFRGLTFMMPFGMRHRGN